MVYCGKASKGCQHCRTRRIKCDKLQPECSQCIRAGKKCPGYRDQLSLMFRDENTKVIQKAHAQWGGPGSSDSPSTSSSSPSSTGSPAFTFAASDGTQMPMTPISRRSSTIPSGTPLTFVNTHGALLPMTPLSPQAMVASSKLPKTVPPSLFEKGIQFYVDHYILGYPQEAKSPEELQDAPWMATPNISEMMAAVGLSGLSNLTGDGEMELEARQKYGLVLRNTAKSIRDPKSTDHRTAVKMVVLLAMFEVVQGKQEVIGSVKAHIMGAAALLTSVVPSITQPTAAFRGIIQLCLSMLIPCYTAGISIPKRALEWIMLSKQSLPHEDQSAAELLLTISTFLEQAAGLRRWGYIISPDNKTFKALDNQLATWEAEQMKPDSLWRYTTHEAEFAPESAFRNRYHVYVNGMWSARVWNHYRWARILVLRTILEQEHDSYRREASSASASEAQNLETIRRMAEDLLVSLPTHFRHPRLTRAQRDLLDRTCTLPPGAAGGVASASVPSLMVQIKVACCAPGVPREYGEWALRVLETCWAETGMAQAHTLADLLRAHLEREFKVDTESAEIKEEDGA